MAVNEPDQNPSKVEFDNVYYKLYEDAINLIEISFGASKSFRETHPVYLMEMSEKVLNIVFGIGTYIRIANSIYPIYHAEAEERRIQQDKAIGLCYDLLTKYQVIMKTTHVKEDKYVDEIKHIVHEINCLKKWRTSDKKRFENLP